VASTLPEIELLVDAAPTHKGPFLDILYGVGISESKLSRIHTLQTKLSKIDDTGRVHVMVDHPSQVEWMEHFCRNVSKSFQFSAFLKLDTGYHRAGTTCDARGVDVAMKIIQSPHVTLFGLYSHW
jgi:D-serine deaminase-like pyridoxal phosphate-dependent protein